MRCTGRAGERGVGVHNSHKEQYYMPTALRSDPYRFFFMRVIVMNLFISMSNETKKWQNTGLTLSASKTVADSIALN